MLPDAPVPRLAVAGLADLLAHRVPLPSTHSPTHYHRCEAGRFRFSGVRTYEPVGGGVAELSHQHKAAEHVERLPTDWTNAPIQLTLRSDAFVRDAPG